MGAAAAASLFADLLEPRGRVGHPQRVAGDARPLPARPEPELARALPVPPRTMGAAASKKMKKKKKLEQTLSDLFGDRNLAPTWAGVQTLWETDLAAEAAAHNSVVVPVADDDLLAPLAD